MKNWTLRFRKVDEARFEEIRNGRKQVETRAATTKYLPIAEGDTLTFVCGTKRIKKTVKKRHHFKTATAMIKKIPLKRIMPDIKDLAGMKQRYASYPGYEEKIKDFGLLAFELR
jgi:ASC-1-like (ASCH) protein